ncbi:MAG: KamA family radical SAM protein [Candidatus Magnetomorum sp.]|nr:KamA family radical SAM protein [Candidatus Magnetomorum sp.]
MRHNTNNPKENRIVLTQPVRKKTLSTVEDLKNFFHLSVSNIQVVIDQYPMRIHPYVANLMAHDPDGPLCRQFIPTIQELYDNLGTDDPLSENLQSPVRQIIHRYPDRVVFLVSNTCPSFCRFCMRKRFVGKQPQVCKDDIQAGLSYIAKTLTIREVILSGGDPFMQDDQVLFDILDQIKKLEHVQILRIHSRIPILMPERITSELILQLRAYHPLYINLHVNHPEEFSDASQKVVENLADAGFPLGAQTVLLKGVNDHPETMLQLMQKLLTLRIRPYYLHHMDDTQGTRHFQTSIDRGLQIMERLRGYMSGMGIPQYMIDLPGGGGKVPLLPDYVLKRSSSVWLFKNFEGKHIEWKTRKTDHTGIYD